MRLILLDRDGTLNQDRTDSVRSPGDIAMIPGAAAAVARLNRAGLRTAIVTNQSVVGKGIIDQAMLERIHDHLRDQLRREGAHIDGWFVCTDPPGRPSDRRKPEPGMLHEAMRQFGVSAGETVMIGDDLRDLQAAAAAGCRRILVRTGKGASVQARGLPPDVLPVGVHEDLAGAVAALLGEA